MPREPKQGGAKVSPATKARAGAAAQAFFAQLVIAQDSIRQSRGGKRGKFRQFLRSHAAPPDQHSGTGDTAPDRKNVKPSNEDGDWATTFAANVLTNWPYACTVDVFEDDTKKGFTARFEMKSRKQTYVSTITRTYPAKGRPSTTSTPFTLQPAPITLP